MARSVDTIYNEITATMVTNFAAVGITIDPTKWSKRNMIRMFCYAFAVCAVYIDQMADSAKLATETAASKTPAGSGLWVQAKMFLFQYSSTTPQIIQLIDLVPQYTTIDPTLRIITACSVSSNTPNEVSVKVAKDGGSGLEKLDTLETEAAQSYIDTIGNIGIKYTVISQDPDLMYIDADIYYTGQATTVKAAVIAALVDFLQTLSITNFDGVIKVTDIESVIKSVTGVYDVVLKNVRIRDYDTALSAAPYLVQNKTTLLRQWGTAAGYCDQEITSGSTFDDTLNFIAE